jgi:phage terminase small subunit
VPTLENPRHERFAQERAKGATADAAYITAGFKPNRHNAARLNTNETIQARIAELLAAAGERAEITVARVLTELGKIGFSNMADYMRAGPDGDPYLDFSALTRDQAAALSEVTVEDFKDGRGEDARDVRRVKFKLADKRAALVDIGKHFGMFTERHEHTGKDGGPIEVHDDRELARLIVFQLTKTSRQAEQGE